MPLQPATRDFLIYLKQHKDVRDKIKAERDKTLLYAGYFTCPIFLELQAMQQKRPGVVQLLADVLQSIPAPAGSTGNLATHVEKLTRRIPAKDQKVVWRALSGIFASNAEGTVYFSIGSGIDPATKVFASTEIPVLLRNAKVDEVSHDLLCYYQRCIRNGKTEVNTGFLPDELL